jgi:hypothetical protein
MDILNSLLVIDEEEDLRIAAEENRPTNFKESFTMEESKRNRKKDNDEEIEEESVKEQTLVQISMNTVPNQSDDKVKGVGTEISMQANTKKVSKKESVSTSLIPVAYMRSDRDEDVDTTTTTTITARTKATTPTAAAATTSRASSITTIATTTTTIKNYNNSSSNSNNASSNDSNYYNINNNRNASSKSSTVSPMVKLVGEEAINHLLREEKVGNNANYNLFPKIYPHLQEMGWKREEDLSHGSVYLAPWAAKAVGEGGIIPANGRCDVSLRDNDEEITRMVLNRDYFEDSKKVVSYIRKYGFMRIEGLPLPPTGDRKRVKKSSEKSSDMRGQENVIEQTKTLSMKPSRVVMCPNKEVKNHVSISSSSRLELTGEEIVASTMVNYNAAISNGEIPSYHLLTKLLPLLENIGWRKVTNCSSLEDHGQPSVIYIPQWVNSLCEDGGVMLDSDKSDVLNKMGRRTIDAEKVILNRDYFLYAPNFFEYLTLHGCKWVAECLIHDGCEVPRIRRPTIAVVPSSSNSLPHTVKSTSVLVNESKGKKYSDGVSNNIKAVAVPERNDRKSEKDVKSLSAPLILPVQKKKVPGKIESASLLSSNALACPMNSPSVIVDKDKGKKCFIDVTIPSGSCSSSSAAIESNDNIDVIYEEKARPSTDGNDYVMKLLNMLLLKMFGT